MSALPKETTSDPQILRELVDEQQREIDRLQDKLSNAQSIQRILEEEIRLLRHKRFGARSEKTPSGQLGIFNEAECLVPPVEEVELPSTKVKGHSRKRRGPKPFPADLPRVEIVHELPPEEQVCPHDGHQLKVIGREESEQLDIIPAVAQVIHHVRLKYACPCCEQGVHTAPLPPQPLPKCRVTAGMLAFIVVSKFIDALPLYRLERILKRCRIDLSRTTMAGWMVKLGQLVQPLINLLRDDLLAGGMVQMDETTVQVLNEPGRAAKTKSYMWVQRGGPPRTPIILFDYDESRGGAVPKNLLGDYKGILQTDGYEAYDGVVQANALKHVGCFAHARRKFDEALKAQRGKSDGKAQQGLNLIRRLYAIEKTLSADDPDQRYKVRQEKSVPVLNEIRRWLDSALPQIAPQSLTGKALYYLNRQWPRLIRYCDDGRIDIDNNACERAIRPFVTGRKNWLFSASVGGAKASANLYSLVETARACNIEPYQYLRHVIAELPKANSCADLEALLPRNYLAKNPARKLSD